MLRNVDSFLYLFSESKLVTVSEVDEKPTYRQATLSPPQKIHLFVPGKGVDIILSHNRKLDSKVMDTNSRMQPAKISSNHAASSSPSSLFPCLI